MALLDRCIFNSTTKGTNDFIVGPAVPGFMTPTQAGGVNATQYPYAAQSIDSNGNILEWEVGNSTYSTTGPTLARTTVLFSSNANSKVNFVFFPQVLITALLEDLPVIASGKSFTVSNTLTLSGTDGASVNFGAGGTPLYSNQTITLSGDVTGSGATAITTTLATGNAGNLNSGTLLAARMPALTGDITSTVNTVSTTLAANAVTNAKAAQAGANTLKGNPTSATANVTDTSQPVLGNAGGTGGQITLNGSTSGSTVLSVSATGGAANISSGQSSAVNTLSVSDTVAGNSVRLLIQNGSSANTSIAGLEVVTGIANAFALWDLNNQTANPSINFGWGSGVTAGLNINAAGATRVVINNGMQVGAAPTGGDKGVGTINVSSGIFLNNTSYTNPDYVLEYAFTGKIEKYADKTRAKSYKGRLPLKDLKNHIKETFRLPGITDEPTDVFERTDIALEKIEELVLYIIELEDRIESLEGK